MPPELPEIIIPREKAVFWMDAQGRWHNEHGPFEHPKIIAYFNANIRRDDGGYCLSQEINGHIEKVYFPCEDTALFAVDLLGGPPEELLLNTGARIPLDPDRLAMRGDALYQLMGAERIKFSERCLLKIADRIEEVGRHYRFIAPDGRHPIQVLAEVDV
jgi:hypothetical protein